MRRLVPILILVTFVAVNQAALISYLRVIRPSEYVTIEQQQQPKFISKSWLPNPFEYALKNNIRQIWMNDWTGFGINPQNIIRIG